MKKYRDIFPPFNFYSLKEDEGNFQILYYILNFRESNQHSYTILAGAIPNAKKIIFLLHPQKKLLKNLSLLERKRTTIKKGKHRDVKISGVKA